MMNKITILLGTLLFSFSILLSQPLSQLRIVSKPELVPQELIAKNVRDANGEICAGLIINSDMDGFSFTSNNQIVKITSLPGQDLLFISPDERVVTVYKTGYDPLRIVLIEYGIKLRSGQVWRIKITGDKKQVETNKGKGSLEIETDPSEAIIEIDGLPNFNAKTPFKAANFLAQSYLFKIRKEKYLPIDTVLTIAKGANKKYSFNLIPTYGFIEFSNIEGAEIYINNTLMLNSDNRKVEVPTGKCKVLIRKKYYEDHESNLEIRPGEVFYFSNALIRKKCRINIHTQPEDISVYINGKFFGSTPIDQYIQADKYTIEFQRSGYRKEIRNIEVINEKDNSLSVVMNKDGIVNITGTNNASVSIDELYIGEIPIKEKTLEAGSHQIKVRLKDYDDYEDTFNIGSEVKTLEVNLQRTYQPFRFTLFGDSHIARRINGINILGGFGEGTPGYIPDYQAMISTSNFTISEYGIRVDGKNNSFVYGAQVNLLPVYLSYESFSAESWLSNQDFGAVGGNNEYSFYNDIKGSKLTMGVIPFVLLDILQFKLAAYQINYNFSCEGRVYQAYSLLQSTEFDVKKDNRSGKEYGFEVGIGLNFAANILYLQDFNLDLSYGINSGALFPSNWWNFKAGLVLAHFNTNWKN